MKGLKIAKSLKIAICYLIVIIGITITMSGLWAIDIGASGMVLHAQNGMNVMISNGWWVREPIKQYHIGLWLVFYGMVTLFLVNIYAIYDKRD